MSIKCSAKCNSKQALEPLGCCRCTAQSWHKTNLSQVVHKRSLAEFIHWFCPCSVHITQLYMHPLNYSGTTFLFQKDIIMLSCCLISVSFSPVKNCREFLKKKTFPVQRILSYVRSFFSAMPSLFTILTIHLMRLRFTSIILLTAGKHSLLLFLMLI